MRKKIRLKDNPYRRLRPGGNFITLCAGSVSAKPFVMHRVVEDLADTRRSAKKSKKEKRQDAPND